MFLFVFLCFSSLGTVVPKKQLNYNVLLGFQVQYRWAFAQGIQNGITRRCSSLPICTTHFTGYLTDVGVGLGLWTRAQADGAEPPTLLKVLLFAAGIFFFGLGGVAAMETHPKWGAQAALVPAAIMAAVAGGLIPVIKPIAKTA